MEEGARAPLPGPARHNSDLPGGLLRLSGARGMELRSLRDPRSSRGLPNRNNLTMVAPRLEPGGSHPSPPPSGNQKPPGLSTPGVFFVSAEREGWSSGPFGILARLGDFLTGTTSPWWPLGSNPGVLIPRPHLPEIKNPQGSLPRGSSSSQRSARDSNPQALSGARFRGECNTILPALQDASTPTAPPDTRRSETLAAACAADQSGRPDGAPVAFGDPRSSRE